MECDRHGEKRIGVRRTDAAPGVLANDTSDTGAPLSAGLFSGPSHGSLEFGEDGSFVYQPEAGYAGLDSFLYFANDGATDSMLAAVTIRVGDGGPPQMPPTIPTRWMKTAR